MRRMPFERARFHGYQALMDHFRTEKDFDAYLSELASDEIREKFLHVASIYLFLVKGGDWVVDIEDSNPVVNYFTNSYKLVTLFSLIESLSSERFLDFFQWLNARERREEFPIDRSTFQEKYREYKTNYGSITKCRSFFEALPNSEQVRLTDAFDLGQGRGNLSIEDVATFLYTLRSRFVHQADLILELCEIPHLTCHGEKTTLVELSMQDLMAVFECGVLTFFRQPPDGCVVQQNAQADAN